MRRPFLGVGDKAGDAVVREGLPTVTCSNPPPEVNISTLYMKTWCNACKQDGYIAPRGPRHEGTGPNGQQWALSGDVNICGCSPPPIFHAERNMAQIFGSDEGAAWTGASAATSAAAIFDDTFNQHFRLMDQHTGRPCCDVPYRIVTDDGQELEGRTDSQGYTQRASSDFAYGVTLHIIADETPINPEWDQHL